jgi:hypothetical protein
MRKIQLAVACVVVLLATTGQVQAGTIVKFGTVSGNEKYVHQILGLDIGGTRYDVTFNEGSFNSVYGSTTTPPLTFSTRSTALTAVQSVRSYLGSNYPNVFDIVGFTGDTLVEELGASFFFVPFATTSGFADFMEGYTTDYFGVIDNLDFKTVQRDLLVDSRHHWTTFAESSTVPEPTSFVMWGMGSLGLVGMRLRRKAV